MGNKNNYGAVIPTDTGNATNIKLCVPDTPEDDEAVQIHQLGVERLKKADIINARELYLKAIEMGNVDAIMSLAHLYMGVKMYKEAEGYYLQASVNGNSHAYNNLGAISLLLYKNSEKAEKYFLLACEHGNYAAYENLAYICVNSKVPDFDKAEQYYLLAIEKGDIKQINAYFNLATFYHVYVKNDIKAEEYYLKSVEHGKYQNGMVFFNLAKLYQGKKKDLAIYYFSIGWHNIKDERIRVVCFDEIKKILPPEQINNVMKIMYDHHTQFINGRKSLC
ncbi:MAG: hypothetical protein Edafosvirus6_23 [Edafosvirus sp.]|uniref:Sel1 repeat family protein n=1 Tax=Edafosvirus sp. TaxID=2487765 RepID=A0A3G4ZV15_9VIRU|nr:MAG: hypothetical protein Edafosvirus6_23 [Edafosvirus sp.]